jgi:hypothetical protein
VTASQARGDQFAGVGRQISKGQWSGHCQGQRINPWKLIQVTAV